MKRKDNYWWERTLVLWGKPFIKFLIRTPITPNMVTVFNLMVIFPAICVMALLQRYYLLALFVQVYMFLDVVDGNLARNKNMKSELGRKLDIFADTLFFTVGYFFIGLGLNLSIFQILFAILVQQIYGMTATYYIVPKLRNKEHFEHTKLKKFFMSKDILFGMDATLETLITSIMLLMPIRKYLFIVCPILWILDLIYRLVELNGRLNRGSEDQKMDKKRSDKDYWNTYYKKKLELDYPSNFARNIVKSLKEDSLLVDLGCGNGRDSLFFAQNGLNVIAIDMSESAIAKLQKSCRGGVKFYQGDFVNDDKLYSCAPDYFYSRFTIHAINEEQQNVLIKNVYKHLREGGRFYIEVRSVKDDIFGLGQEVARNTYIYEGHSRRFVVKEELEEQLKDEGFKVVYAEENRQFAPFKDQDPIILRIIAEK